MGSNPSKKTASDKEAEAETDKSSKVLNLKGGKVNQAKEFVDTNAKPSSPGQCPSTTESNVKGETDVVPNKSGELLSESKRKVNIPESRRNSRSFGKDKCLVGLDNRRRLISPQLLFVSKDNSRIQDATNLLVLQPEEIPPYIDIYPDRDMMLNNSASKDTSNTTLNRPSMPWKRKDEQSKKGLNGVPKPEVKQGGPLGPLRYGRLGLKAGVIRKELERDGFLGAYDKKDPDVVLRELRQIGLVRQTTTKQADEKECFRKGTKASKLPPLECPSMDLNLFGLRDIVLLKLAEKERRFKVQREKNENERIEKVKKFNERLQSAKMRRQLIQQQKVQETGENQPKSDTLVPQDSDKLKMKIMNMDLL